MQEQVDDEQRSEYKTRVIVHRDPLVAGNTQIRGPATPLSAACREDEIEHQPGDKRWYEGNQAADIDKCVDSDAFFVNSSCQIYPKEY